MSFFFSLCIEHMRCHYIHSQQQPHPFFHFLVDRIVGLELLEVQSETKIDQEWLEKKAKTLGFE